MSATVFGSTLKKIRERRYPRLSQSRLAIRSGFDHSYVSRLESGARDPTREAVDRLADALRASDSERDELLAASGFFPVNGVIELAMPELLTLDELYRTATSKTQADLRTTVAVLIGHAERNQQ